MRSRGERGAERNHIKEGRLAQRMRQASFFVFSVQFGAVHKPCTGQGFFILCFEQRTSLRIHVQNTLAMPLRIIAGGKW